MQHSQPRVALETTLLAHGLPRHVALDCADQLSGVIRDAGAIPTVIGVLAGEVMIGMSREQLIAYLSKPDIAKANSSNLAALIHQRKTAATTVSATVQLAAGADICIMATGGVGGVHRGPIIDVSADLVALTRFPVAVVCSGCKTILDVIATREALETLGVPVIGWRTDRFPAFYLRDGGCGVDARFDDIADLGRFIRDYTERSGRGMIIANPIAESAAIDPESWRHWLTKAQAQISDQNSHGRDATPRLLAALHDVSEGATLKANLALVVANAQLAAELAAAK